MFIFMTIEISRALLQEQNILKSPKRKMSIIKKTFYLAEIYTSRVLYSYESPGSVDYDGIKKSVISLQNRRGNAIVFRCSFFFSGTLYFVPCL